MGGMAEEFRDMRRARKLRKRGRHRRRCYDWIVVGGDWHYARNRSSFKEGTYKSINATAMGNMVIGVGTVELLLKRSPNERGPPKKYTLTDVLHIPTAPCNGFNPCKRGPRRTAVDMAIRFEESDAGNMSVMQSFNGEDGAPLWFARKFYDWYRVALAGESYGESPLVETGGETRFPFDLSLSSFDVDDIEGQINGLPAKTPLKFTKALFRGGEDTKAEILRQAQAKLREMESWQERTADVLFTEQQDYTIEEPSVASFGERRADVLMIEEQHYMNQEPPVEIQEQRPDAPLVEKPQYTHQQPPVEIQEKRPDVRVVEKPHYTDQQPPVEINTQVEQPLRPGDVGWW